MKIKELLPKVEENISLAKYTTFKIGGNAKYFFTAETKEDIIKAVKAAQQSGLLFFILVGGSNILFSDQGFDGLVIMVKARKNELKIDNIYVEAGETLAGVVHMASEAGLSGLEWAAGVPGTVGGAVRGNAGAFNSSMSDIIDSVEVLDASDLTVTSYNREDCEFEYRNSIFKRNKNLIILSTKIKLKKGNTEEVRKQMKKCIDYRIEHHPLEFPSAGSIFKNPEGFSAGALIDKSGLKGKTIGNAKISEKHCNFIINLGGATAKDILALIKLAKEKVKENFGVNLEEEIVVFN
ncbi:MAG: UDP-N-acetylmuramate dehydrogenase [Patescibacteria group bacterium]|nr:UDP-N-acetylmuramate dehydrogenase [Patescibacteria group bacterium]